MHAGCGDQIWLWEISYVTTFLSAKRDTRVPKLSLPAFSGGKMDFSCIAYAGGIRKDSPQQN